ncbi:F-box protein At4g22280-like [Trifolium pratense]|uniref:F-box protein At4g22280-like n=1 Tax=Trifolium pratense TaxID=57577 RepID=UPI001E696243|nr:F-box protein At4g22280-like [Trifolium pratense]
MSNSATERRKKLKFSEIETRDRLSDLSDCVILHILLFLNANDAVRTCVLSSRWKNLWKLLPELTLHSTGFQTCKIFTNFVSSTLSLRDPSIPLQALDFNLAKATGLLEPCILNMIVNYAISHNIRRLGLCFYSDFAKIPDTIFSCQTLTHLKLAIFPRRGHKTRFPESSNLPALTILQLENLKFCAGDNGRAAEPFSTLNKLKSLLISNCTVYGTGTLCISSATLVNLTLHNQFSNFYTIDLRTPSLCTFAFTGTPYQELSGSDVSSLEHVEIYAEIIRYQREPPLILFNWLREFRNIKSLTVSATTLRILYLIPNLLKINFPSLGNLESLRVKMEPFSDEFRMTLCHVMLRKAKSKKESANLRRTFREGLEPSSLIPDGIMDFLLQNSPTAKVDFIDCSRKPRRPTHL